ncbi:MAG: pyridoxamine 5'-phosphate oxidase family protein [Ruminococcaceae bacterium]|nr:pyridoxamine 5'-phosphate oxidase family protein [Oscillospiraceae bacterium]
MFRELTRKNKALASEECFEILKNETRGVLSVNGDGGFPYSTPMNHFYDEESKKIYFHCGKSGHRLDSLKENNKVSFCVYDQGFKEENDWAFNVKSVIIFGEIKIIEDEEKIKNITTKLCYKFTDDEEYIKNEIKHYLSETLLLELTPLHICGKKIKES